PGSPPSSSGRAPGPSLRRRSIASLKEETMPEQPQPPEESGGPSPRLPNPSPPAEQVQVQARLEDYPDHVCAPLVRMAPYPERRTLRAEWRAHLTSLAAAYEELGSNPEKAVEEALTQFGDPRRLGSEWANEWKRHLAASASRRPRRPPVARRMLLAAPL